MSEKRKTTFCTECRTESMYTLIKVTETEVIKDKEYTFEFTRAICDSCGEEITIPGLIDLNNQERDMQYRCMENIISVSEIEKLIAVYKLGKSPLSLALGFGEVTISRYLEGQMPSRTYSDIMRAALASPNYMEQLLEQNKEKITEVAYHKAKMAIDELKELFVLSDEMLACIAYIFQQMQEVTPLALQKMLYYIQGLYMAQYGVCLFSENCYAWIHGPVYETVYNLFRSFKYSPIDDDRFVLFAGKESALQEQQRTVIDLVIASFGKYSGKVLEHITHKETPWMMARAGYAVNIPSQVLISKESIEAYFVKVAKEFDIRTVKGLDAYIESKL